MKVMLLLAACILPITVACANSLPSTSPPSNNALKYGVSKMGKKLVLLGNAFEINVDNCGQQRDSIKKEERSKTYRFQLSITISAKVGAELGGDMVAQAKIATEIGNALNISIGAEDNSKSIVEITTPPGKRSVTTLQWKESWTQGSISIDHADGTVVDVLPFTVLDSLVLEQKGSTVFDDCAAGTPRSSMMTESSIAIQRTPTPTMELQRTATSEATTISKPTSQPTPMPEEATAAPTPTSLTSVTPITALTVEPSQSIVAPETPPDLDKISLINPATESAHPYENKSSKSWLISGTDSGASATRLHLSRLELEDGVDWLVIMDAKDTEIQRFTGTYPNGIWTDPVQGNLVKLSLITDGSIQKWGFSADKVASAKYATIAYSPHPYPDYRHPNYKQDGLKWAFDNLDTNSKGTRLHLSRLELEDGVDWLVVMDLNELVYQWITGLQPNGLWTVAVPGNGIIIKLYTDSSVSMWGINVDRLESADPGDAQARPETSESLAESKHIGDRSGSWSIVNPNASAAHTKIHFTRLEMSGGCNDNLVLLDGNGNAIQTFDQSTHVADFWSDDVPGRIVKIQLKLECGNSWGFRVDKLANGDNAPSLAESKHIGDRSGSWSIVNPDASAAHTKIHFTRLEMSGGCNDNLVLLDGNGNAIQTFDQSTHVADFWSDDVPGRIVKIQLKLECGNSWGFRVDKLANGTNK